MFSERRKHATTTCVLCFCPDVKRKVLLKQTEGVLVLTEEIAADHPLFH